MVPRFFVLLLATIYQTQCSSDFYSDILDAGLYKGQSSDDELYRYLNRDSYGNPEFDEVIPVNIRESAEIRDPELLQQNTGSNLMGKVQYISGGAGEGKQHLKPDGTKNNVHEVKSDEALPFYCHPPNPCPKGFTEKDGCQENVADTAEEQRAWIEGMQSRGLCSCDAEHMFHCKGSESKSSLSKNMKFNSPLDSLLDNLLEETNKVKNPYMNNGQKRGSLVAKKSPTIFKRSVEKNLGFKYLSHHDNPYLDTTPLRTVQKKTGPKI